MSETKLNGLDILYNPDERSSTDLGSVAMPESAKELYHLAITSKLIGSNVVEGQLVIPDLGGPGASTVVEIG
ncbi:hypothetical protein KW803_01440 [Candidatus Saccharibacteria bacterium]|nr:hypothetical protein [Candidatus Saccharibacteria bacterium]